MRHAGAGEEVFVEHLDLRFEVGRLAARTGRERAMAARHKGRRADRAAGLPGAARRPAHGETALGARAATTSSRPDLIPAGLAPSSKLE